MKKKLLVTSLLAVMMLFVFAGCGGSKGDTSEVKVDLKDSKIYTEEDRQAAADVITKDFEQNFKGCKLKELTFASDSCNTKENIKWLNELAEGQNLDKKFTQVIQFTGTFHSPVEDKDVEGTAWAQDQDYTGYGWWLAREDGGDWVLVTNGYG